MSAVGGDIIEAAFNHPTLGSGVIFPKANEDGTLDTNAQRTIFYSHGSYRDFLLTLSNGNKLVTGMFIFTKPVYLFTPGRRKDSNADSVVNELSSFNNFIELQ